MYPDTFSLQETQYKLSNLLFGIILVGLACLTLYLIWRWCSENDQQKKSENLFMKPVYAHEIEPGIVVLQSEDGEYFKIMKEYDLKANNRYGSVSCTRPEALQPSQSNAHLERSVMNTAPYMAAASFQTQSPSAPEFSALNNPPPPVGSRPPPYRAN